MTVIGAVRMPHTSFFDSPIGKATEVAGGLAVGGGLAFGIAKWMGKSTGASWKVAGIVGALAGVGLLLGGCTNTGGSHQAPSNPTNNPAPLPIPVPVRPPAGGGVTSPGDDPAPVPVPVNPGSGGVTSPGDDPTTIPVPVNPGSGGVTSPGDDPGTGVGTAPGDDSGIGNPPFDPGIPTGATAQCRDGAFSFSQTHSGTCSHHGGVAVWYQ